MIGTISAAYIRGRQAFLQQRPARPNREGSLALAGYYSLGYNDAQAQARGGIVQLAFPLDSADECHENIPVPSGEV